AIKFGRGIALDAALRSMGHPCSGGVQRPGRSTPAVASGVSARSRPGAPLYNPPPTRAEHCLAFRKTDRFSEGTAPASAYLEKDRPAAAKPAPTAQVKPPRTARTPKSSPRAAYPRSAAAARLSSDQSS